MSQRKGISRSTGFRIFARDNFTCRYCGRQSDVVPLEIDHVHPVSKGGTNDDENLITACEDCNGGKGAKTIAQTVPTEADRLRLAQERHEQIRSALDASAAASARLEIRRAVRDYWCASTGNDSVDSATLNVIVGLISEFGVKLVFRWIEKAASVTGGSSDNAMGRYVSGIARSERAEK